MSLLITTQETFLRSAIKKCFCKTVDVKNCENWMSGWKAFQWNHRVCFLQKQSFFFSGFENKEWLPYEIFEGSKFVSSEGM